MLETSKGINATNISKDNIEGLKNLFIFVTKVMENEQSAAKPLNSQKEQEERSETISQESRNNHSETGRVYVFRFYALVDTRSKEIRYIGRTNQSLHQRLKGHLSETNTKTVRKERLTKKE